MCSLPVRLVPGLSEPGGGLSRAVLTSELAPIWAEHWETQVDTSPPRLPASGGAGVTEDTTVPHGRRVGSAQAACPLLG